MRAILVPGSEAGIRRLVEPAAVRVVETPATDRDRRQSPWKRLLRELEPRRASRGASAGEELVADPVLLQPVDEAAVEHRARHEVALVLGGEAAHDAPRRAAVDRADANRRAARIARGGVEVGDPRPLDVGLGRNPAVQAPEAAAPQDVEPGTAARAG